MTGKQSTFVAAGVLAALICGYLFGTTRLARSTAHESSSSHPVYETADGNLIYDDGEHLYLSTLGGDKMWWTPKMRTVELFGNLHVLHDNFFFMPEGVVPLDDWNANLARDGETLSFVDRNGQRVTITLRREDRR